MTAINETYRDYLVNTPDVGETIKDVTRTLGDRAEILLAVSQEGETRRVRYMPRSVEIEDDTFISRGKILPQQTEASIKAENNEEALVMIADLDSADDQDAAPAA